jgi:lysophospholipase L1-like esterase
MLNKLLFSRSAPLAPAPAGTIRVACVGDSLTYGFLVRRRARNCYPVQLAALLGPGYAVRNFGANGRAMLQSADLPYWQHPHFASSSAFQPKIVIILLGTNDSRRGNWSSVQEYIADYRKMAAHYRSLASQPVIYAMTPPSAFPRGPGGKLWYGMSNAVMDEISAALRALAQQEPLKLIDLRAATAAHPECFFMDGIHTNVAGAALIARTVQAAILQG